MSVWKGKNISIEIFGESHSERIGVTVNGFPEMPIDLKKLGTFLERRKASSGVFSTARIEPDVPVFEGVENEKINGQFTAYIYNANRKSNDYNELLGKPRPSHADYCAYLKDGTTDFTGGGRFSGRLTAPLCIAGGIAKDYLEKQGIYVLAYISSVGKVKGRSYKDGVILKSEIEDVILNQSFPSLSASSEMIEEISKYKAECDSLGGVVECIVFGMKQGLGDCLFGGLEGKISSLVYSIPAVKGVEFGDGFDITKISGSQANDEWQYVNGKVRAIKNSAGGINGGISNGENVTLSVAFRPTPSIAKEQNTVDLIKGVNTKIKINGRHDACIVPRAVPCVESAVALSILDEIL